MTTKKERITAIIRGDMVDEVEDYRFLNRFPTLTKAVNHLIAKGLEAEKNKEAA